MYDEWTEETIKDIHRRLTQVEAYLYGKAEDRVTAEQPLAAVKAITAITAIPRGKYQGKRHHEIVKKDPSYVCWLAEGNLAASFGFTDGEVAEAKRLVDANRTG